MWTNYLKIAYRNLWRNKIFSLTNLLGLIIGCTCTLFIVLWVFDELTFDKFHENYKDIYQVMAHRDFDGKIFTDQNMVLPLSQAIEAELPEVEHAVFKSLNPVAPFDYQFVDQEFGRKFVTEELISKLTNIFSGLAIFICCMGLAGLASYTIEKRTREIGVRKVLGATVSQILLLVSKDFLKLVLIAFCIAVPFAYWQMNNWLENYTYHISISVWLFALVGIAVLLLSLVVVGMNSLRAAVTNPVDSLRSD